VAADCAALGATKTQHPLPQPPMSLQPFPPPIVDDRRRARLGPVAASRQDFVENACVEHAPADRTEFDVVRGCRRRSYHDPSSNDGGSGATQRSAPPFEGKAAVAGP
jgi:hypothetical protein